jgi:L-2-hydroxyglutarate oxidase
MSSTERFDVIVIGAGLVGLSSAFELAKLYPGLKIGVLEKDAQISAHQSGRNSGVIHSGIYYKPGSLKAKNCIRGRELLINFAREHRLQYNICGKIIVATEEGQLQQLKNIYSYGIQNGLLEIELVDASGIPKIEPYCRGLAAIWVPYAGVIDYIGVAQKLSILFQECNPSNRLYLKETVHKISYSRQVYTLISTQRKIECKHIITCAGLQSDRVAKLLGLKPSVQIVPFRGDYYHLKQSAASKVKGLIYPTPDPHFPFLGVHFTRLVNGEVECGPSAVFSFKREGYRKTDFDLYDTIEALSYPGTLRLLFKNWKIGWLEMKRAFSKTLFLKSLQQLIPSLTINDIERPRSGIRAVALKADGSIYDDFYFEQAEGGIFVLNAPSPAATACLAIGEHIAALCAQSFKL